MKYLIFICISGKQPPLHIKLDKGPVMLTTKDTA